MVHIYRQNWNNSCYDGRSMSDVFVDAQVDRSKILQFENNNSGKFTMNKVASNWNDVIKTEPESNL